MYRRSVLMEIEEEFMHETFWGVPCLSGDDKRLTTLTLERGHLTYMQRTAQVWSTFPDSRRVFRKQRLRWARNTWRSDLRALSRRWVWSHPFLAFTMVDKAVSGFTVLLGPIFMIWAIVLQNWIFVGVLALWWQISRSAKLLPHLYRRPSSFFFIPAYLVFSWVMAIIKIHALLTIRKQRWLTRQVAVENGEVVRTSAAADDAAASADPLTEPLGTRQPRRRTRPPPSPSPSRSPRPGRGARDGTGRHERGPRPVPAPHPSRTLSRGSGPPHGRTPVRRLPSPGPRPQPNPRPQSNRRAHPGVPA